MNLDTPYYQFFFQSILDALEDDVIHEILNVCYVKHWRKSKLTFDSEKTLDTFYFVITGIILIYVGLKYDV